MKLRTLYIFLMSVLLMGCTKGFDEIENLNSTTSVPPSLLFTGITRSTFAGLAEAGQQSAQFYVHYNGGLLDEITYYFQRASYNEFSVLRQVERMRIEARAANAPQYYEGLAKFFRAYLFVQLTQRVGDIPYSEALKALDGISKPKYDTQKEVYIGVLKELEEANDLIPAKGTVVGDIMYDGNLLKWKKLVNTFRLKVLISLSLKEGDADLNIKKQFKEIYDNPTKYPVMQSNADNLQFRYYDVTGAKHFWATFTDATPYRMTSTLGDILKANQDPRLFSFFEVPALPANLNPTSFTSYTGMAHGLPTSQSASLEKSTSPLHSRYRGKAVVEPYINLAYHEFQFVLAEAAYRGWISANPETFYVEGIKSSCRFYGISESAITTFLNGAVKYDESEGLRQISIQRWIGYFMNSGYEALWNHRRTRIQGFDPSGGNTSKGYPEFVIGIANRNDGQIPYRYSYPLDELNYNAENVIAAISRQYGSDDINGKMWILKKQ